MKDTDEWTQNDWNGAINGEYILEEKGITDQKKWEANHPNISESYFSSTDFIDLKLAHAN